MDSYNDVEMTCSCGAKAVLTWNGTKYVCDTPGWVFDTKPDKPGSVTSPCWNCGQPGHRQGEFRNI